MNADWLAQYPRAAAMLQGDDDVLEYAPRHSGGLDGPEPARAGLTLLAPSHRPGATIRHAVVPRLTRALLEAPVREGLSFEWCDTLLDARMGQPAGQPCPCGAVRWYQEPPQAPAPDADEEDRGDW